MRAASLLLLASLFVARSALAQDEPPPLPPSDPTPPPPPPSYDPPLMPSEPQAPPPEPVPEPMSEGRRIVALWNTGFQWGISPGVFWRDGDAAFALAVRLGYGFDLGSVILVPGVRLAGYFATPNVYLGMPVMKTVFPIDRFAPFVEAGIGGGYQAEDTNTGTASKGGLALMAGGGFMIHFTMRFGLGVEANYTTILNTDFHGIGVGPILALGF